VSVRLPGGARHVGEDALRSAVDVPAGTYTLRAEPGGGDAIAHPPAVSLARVLELAGVAPAALRSVAIARPRGAPLVLHAPDLARPAPFPDGPPIVWLDGGSVRFLRPVRDAADVNAADNIATTGGDLVVRVQQGVQLSVSVRVSRSRARARERVHLEAHVDGMPGGGAAAVRWRFGDGATATGAAVAHRWRAPGVYSVVAAATGADGSSGASEPVLVRVGAARAEHGATGGGTGDRERAAATGPLAPPPAAQPEPPPADSMPRARPAPAADSTPRARPAPAAAARKQRLRANRADASGKRVPVRGVLVAATIPAAAAAGPATTAAAAARRGGLPARRDVTLAVVAAAACALLALGGWCERRRSRR
jgi:hypothetical protein